RKPRLYGESGVAAGEDEAEPVVVDGAEWLGGVGGVGPHQRLPVLFLAPGLAPDPVDGLAVGGRGEPRARTRRDAVDRPALDGGRQRLRAPPPRPAHAPA